MSLIFFFYTSSFKAQVVINEYSCSNFNSYLSNLGNYEDWVELYNTGATAVNLNGYHLSHKTTNLAMWTFGNVNIPANGFLRIWASGSNVTTGANLHTNFNLTQCKQDKIIFSDPASTVIDSLTVKLTQRAHSRGRTTNGAATWSLFLTATPNASNNTVTAYQGYATTPSMNTASGFYTSSQTVSMSSPDPNITIRYTTNGSTPTASSTLYSTPITVATTTVVRAKAFSSTAGIAASFVESNTFFINSAHTVNVVSFFGDQVSGLMSGNQTTPEAGVEYFDSSGTFKTETYGEANKHGNDSWAYSQRGIDFISRDEFGYNYALLHRIFNVKTRNEFQHIIFKAAANDNYPFEGTPNSNFAGEFGGAHIRDQYVQTVSQKAGLHMDERTWAPMVLYVNGQYWGLYDIREKVDDRDFLNYYHNAKTDSIQMLKNWGGVWAAYGGNQAITDWNTLRNYITSNNMAVAANYNYVDSKFSVASFVDYIILNSYCVTSDWLNWNSEWWRGTNVDCDKQKWRYCLWDEDATFHHYINYTDIPNQNANASPCDPQGLNPNPPDLGGNIDILNALMQNSTFKEYYITRYFDLTNSGLSCQRMTDILDSMVTVITPEMQRQITRWGGSMAQWNQNVTALRNFILQRCDSISQQFDNCYNVTGPYNIKINVDPPGAGTVDFNTNHISSFVWSGLYPGNVTARLSETPNSNYCFSHWELQNHTALPNTTNDSISFALTTTDSIIAHFIYNGPPTISPVNPTVCSGQPVTLTASGGSNLVWTASPSLSCTSCASTIATPTISTTYTVTATNGVGCTNQNTVTVNIVPPAPIPIAPANPTICSGDSVILTATSGSNFNWLASGSLSCTNCASTVATPTVNTSYTVTGINAAGCASQNTVTVNVVPYAIADFTNNALNEGLPTAVSFMSTSSQSSSCNWYFDLGQTSNLCNASYIYTTPGTYEVTLIAYGQSGCNDTITKEIIVLDTSGLVMPNVFSPNGDGINDYFQPIAKNVKKFSCLIFDRWGRKIYEFKSVNDKWNGQNMNGGNYQDGTYYYIMDATDENNKTYNDKGFISLTR